MSYIEELAATRKALVGNEIFFFAEMTKKFLVAGIDPRPLTIHNYPSLSFSQAWLWCPDFGRSRGPAWRGLSIWFLPADA